MALGGSTNTVLHTLAIANEAGVEYSLEHINEVAERVPHLSKLAQLQTFILRIYMKQAVLQRH